MQNQHFLSAILVVAVVITASQKTTAQNIGISNDNSAPHTSAMLDIKNPNKGMLVPRIALTGANDVTTIASAATSLLVYNTATAGTGINTIAPGYYFWNGAAWLRMVAVDPGSNVWLSTGNAGMTDPTSFIGTTDNVPLNIRVNNQRAGRIDSTIQSTSWGFRAGGAIIDNAFNHNNTAIGYKTSYSNLVGNGNTAVGTLALYSSTHGFMNIAIGFNALYENIDGDYNTAIGANALKENKTSYNTAVGYRALENNTTGTNNTGAGYISLANNLTGGSNTAYGAYSLALNTAGNDNTALGYNTLNENITGARNTATGANALPFNTTGMNNTATGNLALYANSTGINNTANGYYSLHDNTSGFQNTATGNQSLYTNTTGTKNTAVGFNALSDNSTGNNNTALGYEANVGNTALTNATAIGNFAIVSASNKIRLGNTTITVIEGQVAYTHPSDARFKYAIRDNVPGLAFIKKLTPVTYYFDEQQFDHYIRTGKLSTRAQAASYTDDKQLQTGFLAQDVEKAAKELGYNFDGVHAPSNDKDYYGVAYSQFIMPLVKGMQEQQQLIEEQHKKISSQEEHIKKLDEKLELLTKAVKTLLHK